MSHFYAGWGESNPSEAKQKPGSSNSEFPSIRFSEPESFLPASGVSPHSEYKDRVQHLDPAYRQTSLFPAIQSH
jgi:hypothetical protein